MVDLVDDLVDHRQDHAGLLRIGREIVRRGAGALPRVIDEDPLRPHVEDLGVEVVALLHGLRRDGELREGLVLDDRVEVRQIVGDRPVEIGDVVDEAGNAIGILADRVVMEAHRHEA